MTVLITGHALEMNVAILARNIPLVGRMPNVKPVLTGQSAAVPMAGQETLTLNATNVGYLERILKVGHKLNFQVLFLFLLR